MSGWSGHAEVIQKRFWELSRGRGRSSAQRSLVKKERSGETARKLKRL